LEMQCLSFQKGSHLGGYKSWLSQSHQPYTK
jgi:hypothetical protein